MHQRGTIKAPASPHTTRAGGVERDEHLGGVKGRGGLGSVQYEPLSSQRCAEKAKNALRTPRPLRFKVHTNSQTWLPPAALTGCGGRGIGKGQPRVFLLLYILTAAGS
jgi:hypothetical protein